MSEMEFRNKRRQQFLTEKYFNLNLALCERLIDENQALDRSGITSADPAYPAVFRGTFKQHLKVFILNYTAGRPIDELWPLYAETMRGFTAWHAASNKYLSGLSGHTGGNRSTDLSPFRFEDLLDFQTAVDVISIGLLLGEGDMVRQASLLMNSNRGTDMLFEALIEPAVSDPQDVEEFFHEEPYGLLLDAIYTADSPAEASAYVKQYLDQLYQSFEGAPWHRGHTQVTNWYSNYEGYWAFDAAAICVTRGIDDISFRDHLMYPKDLADWARAHNVLATVRPGSLVDQGAPRCASGNPCPREGYWLTPAAEDSRRYFQSGEIMPAVGGKYGATIWQWDSDQAK